MATLTASPAMKARLVKAAPAPPHQAAQHAADKSPKPPPAVQQKPAIVQPPALEDPEVRAQRTARLERQNVLWARLRALSPALFATIPPPPMAIGVYDELVRILELDAEGARDLGHILRTHVVRLVYQRALAAEGAVRLDLEGRPAGEVTHEQRAGAALQFEHLKAKRKAKTKAARDGAGK
jgi:hypothetical protein